MTAPKPGARKPLTSAHVGAHLFEVWRTPYGDFQILHYVGRYLIPLHRTEPTEPRARELFERVVERYTESEASHAL